MKLFLVILSIQFFVVFPAFSKSSITYKILITGFEPFGGFDINPSEELIRFINSQPLDNISDTYLIKGITLPVTYFESWEILHHHINDFKPDFIISLGYAPNSNEIKIESIAKNKDNGYKDNIGKSHYGKIIAKGAMEYKNDFPIKKIERILNKNKIKTSISNDAGGYLCNHIFYNLMYYSSIEPEIKSGFIHIPSWSVKRLWDSVKIIIDVLINNAIKIGVFDFEPIKNDVNKNLFRIEENILDIRDHYCPK